MNKGSLMPALLAVFIIIIIAWMSQAADTKGNKHENLVLLVEFAKNKDDIIYLFSDESKNFDKSLLARVVKATKIDFLFLLSYTLYMIFFVRDICGARKSLWVKAAIITAFIIGSADIGENIQLLKIFRAIQGDHIDDFRDTFEWLSNFSRLKWGFTAAFMLLIVPVLWPNNIILKGMSLLAAGTCVLGILAITDEIFNNSLDHMPRYTLLVFITLGVFIVYSIFTYLRNVILARRKTNS